MAAAIPLSAGAQEEEDSKSNRAELWLTTRRGSTDAVFDTLSKVQTHEFASTLNPKPQPCRVPNKPKLHLFGHSRRRLYQLRPVNNTDHSGSSSTHTTLQSLQILFRESGCAPKLVPQCFATPFLRLSSYIRKVFGYHFFSSIRCLRHCARGALHGIAKIL